MPRPARPWFRFYVEALSDRKLRRLVPAHRWLFVACLAAARQSPVPGDLLVAEGSPMTDRDLADFAGMDMRTVRTGMRALVGAGLIEERSRGDREEIVYRSPAFLRRQYESDDVTKRTRKHRASRADEKEGTFLPRSEERSGNGRRNVPETETETEPVLSTTAAAVTPAERQQRVEQACRQVADERAATRPDVGPGWAPAAARGLATDHHQSLHTHLAAHPDATTDDLAALIEATTRPPRPEPPNTSSRIPPVQEVLADRPPADHDLNAAGASQARAALRGKQ